MGFGAGRTSASKCRGGWGLTPPTRRDRPQTQVCGSGRGTDQMWDVGRAGAAGAVYYRRADCRSAGVTLSVARRVYRPVVKDPAGWDVSKPTGGPPRRRHFVPSAQEPSGAHRRRIGRRTRPEAAGEVATSIRRNRIRRRRADVGAVIKEKMLLTEHRSKPHTHQKVCGRCTPKTGCPPEKKRGAGGKKNEAFCSPPLRPPPKKHRAQSKPVKAISSHAVLKSGEKVLY